MTVTAEQLAEWRRNRRKWAEALRSGKYTQTKGCLFDGVGHCCLGVLCRVAGIEPDEHHDFHGNCTFAPSAAVEFVGLYDAAGVWKAQSLADLNDAGHTFSEIADIIESEPPGLFIESMED